MLGYPLWWTARSEICATVETHSQDAVKTVNNVYRSSNQTDEWPVVMKISQPSAEFIMLASMQDRERRVLRPTKPMEEKSSSLCAQLNDGTLCITQTKLLSVAGHKQQN